MKIRNLMASAMVLAIASYGTIAAATIIISDDFEGYADTAALNAVWPIGAGTESQTFLDTTPDGSQAVAITQASVARSQSFSNVIPTESQPLRVAFDLYDPDPTINANQYIQLRAAPLTQLIALGKSNLAGGEGPADPTKWQARIAFDSLNWFNLDADRSAGRTEFEMLVYPDRVTFFVNGTEDRTVAMGPGTIGSGFASLWLGSTTAGTIAGTVYYDNVLVQQIPEPSTAILLGLAGLGLVSFRKRS